MVHRHFLCVTGVGLIGAASLAHASLTHLYTFNNGTANDSVGNADGTLMTSIGGNTATLPTVTGGQLVFDPAVNNGSNNPAGGQYVALPFNVARTPSFTFEVWATDRVSTPWQRLIDLNNGTSSFQMFVTNSTPSNTQGMLGQVSTGNTDFITVNAHPLLNVEHQFVYSYDATAHTEALYLDGQFLGSNYAGNASPANSNFVNFWIGRSPFGADPYFDGTIDQEGIYDTGLTTAQVASDFATGPVPAAVPEPVTAVGVGLFGSTLVRRRRPQK